MKLGVFIHWGVYSVPSFGNEWYWHNVECSHMVEGSETPREFQDRVFGKGWQYPSFGPMFKAELFDATAWAKTIKSSGAQYVLPVAKHHDGFAMWNATTTSPGWNAVELGPKRDVLRELYEATQAAGLDWGIYFSQGEWFDAAMVHDSRNNFTTSAYLDKLKAQRLELIARFPKAMLWHTDGGWFAPDGYWGNLDWLTWLYDESPLKDRVVSCNSLGFNCCTKYPGHGDKCWEYGDAPSGGDRTTAGQVVPHYYTNQMTIQKASWSWDRTEPLAAMLSAADLVAELVQTTAWNGTLVVNIGPTADGRIAPIFEERLASLGGWLAANGAAIYGTRPWQGALPSGSEPPPSPPSRRRLKSHGSAGGASDTAAAASVYYTATPDQRRVYAIAVAWPEGGTLKLSVPRPASTTKATLLSTGQPLAWKGCAAPCSMAIELGPQPPLGSSLAWAVALDGLV